MTLKWVDDMRCFDPSSGLLLAWITTPKEPITDCIEFTSTWHASVWDFKDGRMNGARMLGYFFDHQSAKSAIITALEERFRA